MNAKRALTLLLNRVRVREVVGKVRRRKMGSLVETGLGSSRLHAVGLHREAKGHRTEVVGLTEASWEEKEQIREGKGHRMEALAGLIVRGNQKGKGYPMEASAGMGVLKFQCRWSEWSDTPAEPPGTDLVAVMHPSVKLHH